MSLRFGNHGARGRLGGKADVLLGLDGQKLGLWPGLSVSAHLKQNFGRDANTQGDGSILPVNTALGFPTLGGTTTDLSLIVSQNFANVVTTTGYHSLRAPAAPRPASTSTRRPNFYCRPRAARS